MNKQKGDMKNEAFLTGIVNMLIFEDKHIATFDHDPRNLTLVTVDKFPVRTLSRRVDGAYPKVVDPKVIWEIKEYYYTTTFGSRVADGVYESLLDGLELEETRKTLGRDIKHLLFVDSHFTWWVCGRSYLCRLIDLLNMGYADEVIFGKEVETRLPVLISSW